MIEEAVLFTDADRFYLKREQIDCFTVPLGDRYDDDTFDRYFAVYAGVARKYKPQTIFEIGVRFGCTAICMMLGAAEVVENLVYRGIDDESYDYDSCAKANRNFQEQVPWANARCIRHNAFHGPHEEINRMSPYDLIHIDGHHAYNAVSNELPMCWGLLANKGIIICDDADTPGVQEAIEEFLAELKADTTVLARHQFYSNARNHRYIQKICL